MPYQAKTDKIYMMLQRGDSELAPGKHPNLRLWDGMVGYLDPQEWEVVPTFSDYWLGETCVVELGREWKPLLLEANKHYESVVIGSSGFPVTGDSTKRTRGYVDIASLAPMISGVSDFSDKYYQHKTKLPVIDGSALPQSILLDTKGVDFTKRPLRADVGVITSGSYTVGPDGGDDYPTFGGVGGAWTALGNLTGDLTLTNTGAITEGAFARTAISLGGFTLNTTSDTPHGGDPTAGHLITINVDAHFFDMRHEGAGTFRMQNLHTFRQFNNTTTYFDYVVVGMAVASNIYLHDLLVDHNSKDGGCVAMADNTPFVFMYNCELWDAGGAANGALQVNAGGGNATSIYEHNTAYSATGRGFEANNNGGTFKNNAAYDNGTDFSNIGGATGRNNLSSDATAANGNWSVGTDNQINKTAANNLRSTDDSNALFLKVKTGDVAAEGGAAVSIVENTTGIRGNSRPTGVATYSIGSDQIGSITVAYPNGAETLTAGSSINIQWSSENIDGNVQIQLARNGVAYSDLFASTANDDIEPWTVTGPGSGLALIKIIAVNDTGISDVSDGAFNIKPDIVTINPDEGVTNVNTPVVISGFGLSDATFTIDGNAGTVDSQDATTINGSTPVGNIGAKDVVVTSGGQTDTLVGGFTYLAPPVAGSSGISIGMSIGITI